MEMGKKAGFIYQANARNGKKDKGKSILPEWNAYKVAGIINDLGT